MKKYGQISPPEVDLNQWPKDIKYYMASGEFDLLADPDDVNILIDQLNKAGLEYQHKVQHWGHLGFIIANNLDELVNDTLKFLQK